VLTWGHIDAKIWFRATKGSCEWPSQYLANSSRVSLVTSTADRWSLHTCRWLAFSTSSISLRQPSDIGLQRLITVPLKTQERNRSLLEVTVGISQCGQREQHIRNWYVLYIWICSCSPLWYFKMVHHRKKACNRYYSIKLL